MNVHSAKRGLGPREPSAKKPLPIGWLIAGFIALILAAGFWYYFFGRKPKSVLSLSIPSKEFSTGEDRGLWPIEEGDVVVLANDELKRISLVDREVKWSVKVPAPAPVNQPWRDAMNARFVRLQQWADQLSAKRATLKTAEEIKAFNEEAQKYQKELVAVRTDAGNKDQAAPAAATPPPPKVAPKRPEPVAEEEEDEVASLNKPAKLNAVKSPEMALTEQRMQRRSGQIAKLDASIKTKKATAKSELQRGIVAEEEKRHAALLAEQKEDEQKIASLKGAAKPAEAATDEEDEPDFGGFWENAAQPKAALVGSNIWLAESERIVAFDAATGAVKFHLPLSGPIVEASASGGEMHIVAAAGPDARQLTRITAATGPASLYLPAGKDADSATDVSASRTAFSHRLVRADIRLVEKKVTAKDAIKPGAEKDLENAANQARGGSLEEAMAVVKLMEIDGARNTGETKIHIDESSYEVTVRRPFEMTVPEWKGPVAGRVEMLSTPSYELMTAGMRLYVFDHSNRLLWEAPLGARMPRLDVGETAEIVLESNGRLYFADGAFLTAFEGATGKVLWRFPNVGIRKLQIDADGNLYVHSRNHSIDSLSFAITPGMDDIAEPILYMLDSSTGKVQWEQPKYEDVFVSGTHVYVLRQGKRLEDIEEQVFGGKAPPVRVKIYKLSRSSGEPIWEWFEPRRPLVVHPLGRTVGLLFADGFEIVHSISM